MERLYQEVRLISTSSIIASWVLPANIDAKHFPNTFLNLDSGNSQQFVCLSAQFTEQQGTHRSSGGTEHTGQRPVQRKAGRSEINIQRVTEKAAQRCIMKYLTSREHSRSDKGPQQAQQVMLNGEGHSCV